MTEFIQSAQNAGMTALNAALTNPTTDGLTTAVSTAIDTIAEDALKTANPLFGAAASLFMPKVAHNIAVSLVTLFQHIGAQVPEELSKAVAHLEPYVHIDLNGDGKVGL